MIVFLLKVLSGSSNGCIICDMDGDSFSGAFDVSESFEDLHGPVAIFGDAASNEDMVLIRGGDKILGGLKANALISVCIVLASELLRKRYANLKVG